VRSVQLGMHLRGLPGCVASLLHNPTSIARILQVLSISTKGRSAGKEPDCVPLPCVGTMLQPCPATLSLHACVLANQHGIHRAAAARAHQ
jgi:hypothetical protein